MGSSKLLSPEDLLQYSPDYSVLICKSCHYAIQPSGIARHLKEIHHIYRSKRRPYMDYASGFHLAAPEAVMRIKVDNFPVRFLPICEGLQCLGPESCDYLCASTKRMQSHWLYVHKRHGEINHDWRPTSLQTFFRGNLLRYFTGQKLNGPDGLDKTHLGTPGHELERLEDTDRDLLHHYVKTTSLTLVDRHDTGNIWQTIIPQMAVEHPFLMHAVLAVSALHLAHQNPSKRQLYLVQAHHHQDLAMPLYRKAIMNVTESNCHSILAFSYFLVIYSFAADRPDERFLLVDFSSENPNLLCSWLYFVRNSCFIVCGFWESILRGPIGQLALSWDEPLTCVEGDPITARIINDLLSLVTERQNTEHVEVVSEAIYQVYRDTAKQLARAFAAAEVLRAKGFTTWDAVRMWPMEISVPFIELLIQKQPMALVLLAHYCLLLERIQPQWYFEGRGGKLQDAIFEQLDPSWRSSVATSLEKAAKFLRRDH